MYAADDLTLAHASGIIMTSAYSAAMGAARSMAPSVVYQTAYCVALAVPEMASRVFLQVSLAEVVRGGGDAEESVDVVDVLEDAVAEEDVLDVGEVEHLGISGLGGWAGGW